MIHNWVLLKSISGPIREAGLRASGFENWFYMEPTRVTYKLVRGRMSRNRALRVNPSRCPNNSWTAVGWRPNQGRRGWSARELVLICQEMQNVEIIFFRIWQQFSSTAIKRKISHLLGSTTKKMKVVIQKNLMIASKILGSAVRRIISGPLNESTFRSSADLRKPFTSAVLIKVRFVPN